MAHGQLLSKIASENLLRLLKRLKHALLLALKLWMSLTDMLMST